METWKSNNDKCVNCAFWSLEYGCVMGKNNYYTVLECKDYLPMIEQRGKRT